MADLKRPWQAGVIELLLARYPNSEEIQFQREAVQKLLEWAIVLESELTARTAETRPHCWHCQVALEPETPRCESCPAPNDCDVEDCQEPGCTGESCVQRGCRQCAALAKARGGEGG